MAVNCPHSRTPPPNSGVWCLCSAGRPPLYLGTPPYRAPTPPSILYLPLPAVGCTNCKAQLNIDPTGTPRRPSPPLWMTLCSTHYPLTHHPHLLAPSRFSRWANATLRGPCCTANNTLDCLTLTRTSIQSIDPSSHPVLVLRVLGFVLV